MRDKFDEIECSKILLGNKDLGFIELSAKNNDESEIYLEVSVPCNDNHGSFKIAFVNGMPVLHISSEKENCKSVLFVTVSDNSPRVCMLKFLNDELISYSSIGLDDKSNAFLFMEKGSNIEKGSGILLKSSDNNATMWISADKTDIKDRITTNSGVTILSSENKDSINISDNEIFIPSNPKSNQELSSKQE